MRTRKFLAVVAAAGLGSLALVVPSCRTAAPEPQEMITLPPDDGGVHRLGDCHPTPGARGNGLRVGQYCTLHGDQCSKNPGGTANACAIDFDKRAGNYCIKIFCSKSEECGEGACCYGEPGSLAKACIPKDCVADGGVCPR